MKKVGLFILIALLAIMAVVLFKTFTFKSQQPTADVIETLHVDDAVITRLSAAIQLQTVSYQDTSQFNAEPFIALHALMDSSFPLVDSILTKEKISEYSLLYHWQGSDASLAPIVFLAHMDVVPIEDPSVWTVPPFSGKIDGEYIWGRGTLDDKFSVFGVLEAVEMMLKEGYQPKRSMYFAFGHDEEISGHAGAEQMSQLLESRGVKAHFVLDEGLMITQGMVPGIEKPVALIGIAEKGYATLELSIISTGGHSSMPGKENSIASISAAVAALQDNPLPASLSGATKYFIEYAGPEMAFMEKMAFANTWLFGGVIINTMAGSNSGNALVRTTTAPTIFNAGVKENLIPTEAKAIVNFRILPGQTTQNVIDFVVATIANPNIKVELLGSPIDPSPVSSVDSDAFKSIAKTIKQVTPDAVVAPSLVLAATDSRYYTNVSEDVYRFLPVLLTQDDLKSIHGIDERIKIADYKKVIEFYYQLIKNNN